VRRRYESVPLWYMRLKMAFLRPLAVAWPGAMRQRASTQLLFIRCTYDWFSEPCGTRRLQDHFQQLAAQQAEPQQLP
jgi:hypothetical protein